MNELIYWGVVVAGAVAPLIEANRSFRESLTDTQEHPILKGVEVAKLCTSSERNLGFAFYSLFYLAIYGLLLSSTEVFELLGNATQSGTQVGPTDALDGEGEDPLGLVAAGYGKPIFISSTLTRRSRLSRSAGVRLNHIWRCRHAPWVGCIQILAG